MKKILFYIIFIILLVVGLTAFTLYFELNYTITSYSIINIYDNLEIDNENKSNIYTIKENKITPTVINCIKAFFDDNIKIERIETISQERKSEYANLNKLFAKKYAYNAHDYVNIYTNNTLDVERHFYIFNAQDNDNFKLCDELISIDGNQITSLRDINTLIANKKKEILFLFKSNVMVNY